MLSDFEIKAGIAPSMIALAPLILWTFGFHVIRDLANRVEGNDNKVIMKPEQDKVRRTDSNMIETRRIPYALLGLKWTRPCELVLGLHRGGESPYSSYLCTIEPARILQKRPIFSRHGAYVYVYV